MSAALSSALAAEAKLRLGALGLVRKGRSRVWLDDHGWWMLVVEFQPSSSGRFYVNIGEQHLFIRRDHFVFEDGERPLGGTWTGDESDVAMAMEVATEAVLARRVRHGDGQRALSRLIGSNDDLIAGVAAGLLGLDADARSRLSGRVHGAYQDIAAEYLNAVDEATVETFARTVTDETRDLLRLPRTTRYWDA